MNRIFFVGLSVLCMGCLDPEVLYEVEVSASVSSAESGPIEVWFLHSAWGAGELETQYMILDTLWLAAPTTFSQEILVPQAVGSGLSIYAWQDRNEDQEHCRPGTDPELSGLTHVADYPSHAVEVSISLETPCEGPEGL